MPYSRGQLYQPTSSICRRMNILIGIMPSVNSSALVMESIRQKARPSDKLYFCIFLMCRFQPLNQKHSPGGSLVIQLMSRALLIGLICFTSFTDVLLVCLMVKSSSTSENLYNISESGTFSADEHIAGLDPSRGTELCAVV